MTTRALHGLHVQIIIATMFLKHLVPFVGAVYSCGCAWRRVARVCCSWQHALSATLGFKAYLHLYAVIMLVGLVCDRDITR